MGARSAAGALLTVLPFGRTPLRFLRFFAASLPPPGPAPRQNSTAEREGRKEAQEAQETRMGATPVVFVATLVLILPVVLVLPSAVPRKRQGSRQG